MVTDDYHETILAQIEPDTPRYEALRPVDKLKVLVFTAYRRCCGIHVLYQPVDDGCESCTPQHAEPPCNYPAARPVMCVVCGAVGECDCLK